MPEWKAVLLLNRSGCLPGETGTPARDDADLEYGTRPFGGNFKHAEKGGEKDEDCELVWLRRLLSGSKNS